jgi:hypothetical protein
MHDLHEYIECRFQGITRFSREDDFTLLDKQRSFSAIALLFQKILQACLQWVEANAVRFEWSKMEAIPFSWSPSTRRDAWDNDIDLVSSCLQYRVEGWNEEATRWLEVYLDHSLNFAAHCNKVVSKARLVEGRLQSLINKFLIPPASAHNVQVVVAQSTLVRCITLVERQY